MKRTFTILLPIAATLTCFCACDSNGGDETGTRYFNFRVNGTVTLEGENTPLEGATISGHSEKLCAAAEYCFRGVDTNSASTVSDGQGKYSLSWGGPACSEDRWGAIILAPKLNAGLAGYESVTGPVIIRCNNNLQTIDFVLRPIPPAPAMQHPES